eukprot:8621161-Pyramimonas_sp.AAC.1
MWPRVALGGGAPANTATPLEERPRRPRSAVLSGETQADTATGAFCEGSSSWSHRALYWAGLAQASAAAGALG